MDMFAVAVAFMVGNSFTLLLGPVRNEILALGNL
jgi:hypothetical protein